jgi:UDP-N-acetylglucosamine--N-acetylmuramyl-(pentapeptide) pyrophosphoryl-undecaprenol N-acetylglucosamine transferase
MNNSNTQIQVKLDAKTAGLPVIVIMAGGTGGHVFPALAVARWLADAGYRIVWIGNRTGMEADLVPRYGFEMEWISFSGLRGKGLVTKLMLPYKLLVAFAQSIAILNRLKPKAVAGFGGYISFPAGMMAVLLGRSLLLHEQNAVAGLANKVLARVADRVMTAFPNTLPKAVWTGNPVRKEITRLPEPAHRYGMREGALRLLVVGGSLGAQVLNQTVPRALALLAVERRPQVTHQAGVKNIEALRAEYQQAGVTADAVPFIEDMAAALAQADLVICRAGAMTVAEVACAGVAALFVPLPSAVDDHQSANARFLADAQAALLVPQRDFSAESLAATLTTLTREKCQALAAKARALAKPDATEVVAKGCLELAERSEKQRA